MTYDQILTLDSIVNSGSFKSAAELLHKTQPSLSVAIKKLEEEFQFQIFDRSHYRPQLTEKGKVFHQQALIALDSFQALEVKGKELGAGFEAVINVCVEAIFPIAFISPILENFFKPHIRTSLNLNIDVLEGVMHKLEAEEVDFALAPDFSSAKNIEKIKILTTEIIPVIAPKYKDYKLHKLKALPQIVVQSSVKESRHQVYGGLSHQFWYTSDLFMKEQLICAGLGWGSLPVHLVKDKISSGQLVQIVDIPQVRPLTADLYLMRKKTKVMGPNTKKLWSYLSELK